MSGMDPIKNVIQSLWKLFEHTGYQPMKADLQWEVFLNEADKIRKEAEAKGSNVDRFCRDALLSVQNYYVSKNKPLTKETAQKIEIPDRRAIYNALQDARRIAERKPVDMEKYSRCSPPVQVLSSDLADAAMRAGEAMELETA